MHPNNTKTYTIFQHETSNNIHPPSLVSSLEVDCDTNEDLCDEDRWDIEGLPAVKVMRGGKGGPVHDYNGPRRAPDIVGFMRQVIHSFFFFFFFYVAVDGPLGAKSRVVNSARPFFLVREYRTNRRGHFHA